MKDAEIHRPYHSCQLAYIESHDTKQTSTSNHSDLSRPLDMPHQTKLEISRSGELILGQTQSDDDLTSSRALRKEEDSGEDPMSTQDNDATITTGDKAGTSDERLRLRLEELKKEHDRLQDYCFELENELADSEDNSALEAERDELSEEIEHLQARRDSLQEECDELKDVRDELDGEIDDLEDDFMRPIYFPDMLDGRHDSGESNIWKNIVQK